MRNSSAPQSGEIVPYRNALIVNEYSVDKVLKGTYAGKTIRLVQWGILDLKPTPLAAQEPGASVKLVLENFTDHDDPAAGRIRALWVEQNIASIEWLLADVKEAVHRINPGVELGLMTVGAEWSTYSGQAFDRWFTALGATKARPGGGFYDDATPMAMFGKALSCGRQRAILPDGVPDVQYELENFPYQRLKKSATAVVDECSLALANGLNGIAFNMLGSITSDNEDSLPWVRALPVVRPLWDAWVAHTTGLPTAGLWPAWSSQLMAKRAVQPGESWLGGAPSHNLSLPNVLAEIGLPLAADALGCGTVLCGRVAEVFGDHELRAMLSAGVLMDSFACSW